MTVSCEISGSQGGECDRVFWDVEACSQVDVGRCFRGAYSLHHRPDDGGSTHILNVGRYQLD
jgi:hypothetical protein